MEEKKYHIEESEIAGDKVVSGSAFIPCIIQKK